MKNHIPKGWELKKIADIGEVVGGGTPSTKEEIYYGGDIAWLTPKDLSNYNHVFIDRGERNITKFGLKNSSARLMPEGTVLFSSRAPIGYVAIAKNKISTNQGFKSIICNKDVANNKFIYYSLKYYKKAIENIASGSTFKEVSGKVLKEFELLLPPLNEQEEISKILFSIDKKIELNHEMNLTLEAIGQAIFRHWFVHFEFPDGEGRPYKSSGGDMVDSELGEIPQGWEIKPLDKIANYLNGLALQKYPPEDDDYLPVIKIRELKQGITQQTDKASRQIPEEYVIDDGDIIFSWSGSLEVVIWGEGKGALNQHLFKVSSDEFPKWFYYYQTLRFLPSFRQTAADKATTMGHIKRQHLTESLVPVPNNEILSKASMVLKPIINQIINNKTQSRYLKALRDSLLPKLMSGKIRVNVPEEATVK